MVKILLICCTVWAGNNTLCEISKIGRKYIPTISHNQEVSEQMQMTLLAATASSELHWSMGHQVLNIHLSS